MIMIKSQTYPSIRNRKKFIHIIQAMRREKIYLLCWHACDLGLYGKFLKFFKTKCK